MSCLYGAAICICFRHTFALSCIKLCRGRVGLQSGTHADKALHKYINFLECVRCGYYCPAKGYRPYFHASPIPTENIPKCLFFWSYLCMFPACSVCMTGVFCFLKKYPKWICKYWLFCLYTFFSNAFDLNDLRIWIYY